MTDERHTTKPEAKRVERFTHPLHRHIIWGIGLLLVISGILVMCGWVFGAYQITTVFPNYPSMKFNSAAGFSLLGLSILVTARTENRLIVKALGCLISIFGLLTLAQHLFGVDLHIDQLLPKIPGSDVFPGRPSPGTAFSFLICGLLLCTGDYLTATRPRWFAALLTVGLVLPLSSLFTYAYQPAGLVQTKFGSILPLHSALTFFVAFAGIGLALRENFVWRLLIGNSTGSRQFRHLVPPFLALPFALGWYIQWIVAQKAIDPSYGITFFATGLLLTSVFVLAQSASNEDQWSEEWQAVSDAKTAIQTELSMVLDSAIGAIFLFSANQKVRSVNKGASRIFGWSQQEMMQMSLHDFVPKRLRLRHAQHVAEFKASSDSSKANNNPVQMLGLHKDGSEIPILVSITKQHIGGEIVFGAVILDARDVADQISELRSEIRIDALTRVENRFSLETRIREINRFGTREPGRLAVLMMDIDNFKEINDSYGHRAGDHILAAFAHRAGTCLREGDKLYRFGGDEFVVLAHVQVLDEARVLAERILGSIRSEPVRVEDQDIKITTSIGLAMLSDDKSELLTLEDADTALYAAKMAGRNCVQLHDAA